MRAGECGAVVAHPRATSLTILAALAVLAWALTQMPSLAYGRFLADLGAGRVDQITLSGQRLEASEGDTVFVVDVQPGADVEADVVVASAAGARGVSLARMPDDPGWRLVTRTPFVPEALVIVGLLVWLPGRTLRRRAPITA